MYHIRCFAVIVFTLLLAAAANAQAPGERSYIAVKDHKGYFSLAADGKIVPLMFAGSTAYPGVVIAIKSLQADMQSVTGIAPQLMSNSAAKTNVIIIGTIGRDPIIDRLIAQKKLDVSSITGKWEAHITQVVENPLPGIKRALVIVGSDKRGTIYGIYGLSGQIGVSPWHWWADVPVKKHNTLYVIPGKYTDGGPVVKYRGIFINDEAPSFTGWAKEKFGGVNHLVYTKIFELVLRLKGNYLWPAMWDNAFNDDDKLDPILADEYGIVMGTSHHEPMDRAQQEWKRYGTGAWDYQTNEAELKQFWKKGIENMGNKETIVTIGMRGDGDKPMTEGSNIALLEKIVKDQRDIIAKVTGKPASATPQVWALYKEVQDYYDKGMRVPDDVTLLLCDDNWGNIRKLPKLNAAPRTGGYGIYYHFDYVGDPRNYKWLNTNPISKTWEQMHLAYEYGAKNVWIVNVGDLKPVEFPISFFLDYAWSPDKWQANDLYKYTQQWGAQQFGPRYAKQIANILTLYTKYNGRCKPELLDQNTYSLTNYNEFENVVNDYDNLRNEAQKIYKLIPQQYHDAYYQLVLHPVEACANLNELYFAAAKNELYARQSRAATNIMAEEVKRLYLNDSLISDFYNKKLANAKWDHMMDQTHIGYTYWQQPDANKMPGVKTIKLPSSPQMGVAIEGSEAVWPQTSKAVLPGFYPGCGGHYIGVFNRGKGSFNFNIRSASPYLTISGKSGSTTTQKRVWINVNWQKVPHGIFKVPLTVNGSGSVVIIIAVINNSSPQGMAGFYENNGYVSMEAAHYSKAINTKGITWGTIPAYGRTLSGVMAMPVTAASLKPYNNSPHLEYKVNMSDTGIIKVEAYISPTLDFNNGSGLHYAISFDNDTPQIVNINTDKSDFTWRQNVSKNINIAVSKHHLTVPGLHTLKFWMVDPGIVLQKIVINAGGEQHSYLGPPESSHL